MHPEDVTVSEGGTIVLSIDATGSGNLTYEWKKVGSDSLPDTASGGNSTELTITSITSSDSGLYYCIVMNQWGNMVKSNNATVNVLCELVLYCISKMHSKRGYKNVAMKKAWVEKVVMSKQMVKACIAYAVDYLHKRWK